MAGVDVRADVEVVVLAVAAVLAMEGAPVVAAVALLVTVDVVVLAAGRVADVLLAAVVVLAGLDLAVPTPVLGADSVEATAVSVVAKVSEDLLAVVAAAFAALVGSVVLSVARVPVMVSAAQALRTPVSSLARLAGCRLPRPTGGTTPGGTASGGIRVQLLADCAMGAGCRRCRASAGQLATAHRARANKCFGTSSLRTTG